MDSTSLSSGPQDELRVQWTNPGDILSLLLLIGGDIVQKALAQFVGVQVALFGRGPRILITPVAFSFGWVGYAFMSLMSVVGHGELMPELDCPSIVVNCKNAYIRQNNSWILGRILRDHESSHEVDKSQVSIRIDLFTLRNVDTGPDIDWKWMMGWLIILIQQVIAAIPWIKYGDWAIFMVTACGTAGALLTGALPQWAMEKGPTVRQRSNNPNGKVIALTRGNGHSHIMVFTSDNHGWDLEALATAPPTARPETPWICVFLMIWWTLLLITVSGLKKNTWFLIGVGGLGMLQNIFAAGVRRNAGAFGIHLEPYKKCPTIVGYRPSMKPPDDSDSDEDKPSVLDEENLKSQRDIQGVMGALIALENEIPKAGTSLVNIFFPGVLKYEPSRFVFNREKKFWKKAFRRINEGSSKSGQSSRATATEQQNTTNLQSPQ